MNIVAIVNPKSASGRAAAVWRKVQRHLPHPADVLETKAPRHAIELTSRALKQGAQTIVAVGGDGTINEVVNGFFQADRPIGRHAALAVIPHGTGSDFRRMLNLPDDEKKAADIITARILRPIDLMRVQYTTHEGVTALRYCVNVTSFGMGGAVAARANRSSKLFGGKAAFLASTVITTLGFSGCLVTLELDDRTRVEAKITNVAVGNGQFHGGGMWVCPGASLDDGLLDVTLVRYLSLFELLRDLKMLYDGRICEHRKVTPYRAVKIQAVSREPALIEIDGEPLGRLPIEISVLPGALQVLLSGRHHGNSRTS